MSGNNGSGYTAQYSGGIPSPQVPTPQTEAAAEKILTALPMSLNYRATIPLMSYYGAGGVPVLSQTLWADTELMLTHPAVFGPLGYYKAGISNVSFEIKCKRSDAGEYLHSLYKRVWERSLTQIQRGYDYGWMAGEPCYREEHGRLCYDSMLDFHPLDVYALTHRNRYAGVSVHNIQSEGSTGLVGGPSSGALRLWGPDRYPAKGFWFAHNKRYQRFYGQSQLWAAWRPWRRLAFRDGLEEALDGGVYRYIYGGWEVYYPPEDFPKQDGGIDYTAGRNMARQFVEQAKAGAGIAIPNSRDDKGNRKWEFSRPDTVMNFDPALNIVKYLQDSISYGIGVPPELLQASETGSGWSGRKVPLIGFYSGQLGNARAIVAAVKVQLADPLLRWNFGPSIHHEVEVKLVLPPELAGEQQQEQGAKAPTGGAVPEQQVTPGKDPAQTYAPAKEGATLSTEESGETLAQRVERAAQETEPNPTEAQKKSGRYKKGRVTIQGLPIAIENARGSTRSGVGEDGKPWSVTMTHHYGYIGKTESKADGDPIDVFIGPDPESEIVYVVNQKKPNGSFDEHKAMLGFHSEEDAKQGYLASYLPGWKGMGEVTPMTMRQFKEWTKEGQTGKPTPGQTITLSDSDEPPSDDLANGAAERVLDEAMAAYARLSRRIKRELIAAVRSAPIGGGLLAARRVLGRWLPALTAALSDTQLAASLAGMREIAQRLKIEGERALPPGAKPDLEPWRPEPAAHVEEETSGRTAAIAASEAGANAPRLHLPLIDAAVADLRQRNLLTRDAFDALTAEARQKAFTVAGVESEKTLEAVRTALADAVEQGQTKEQFVKNVQDTVDGETFLSPAHAETVFRDGVNSAYSNAQQELLEHPLVGDLFPYAAYYAIDDDRARPEHLAMETRGIQGTNIYRRDDPVFMRFRPPWAWKCRCGWAPLSVRDAARLGIEEAQRWLATKQPPLHPQYVEMPPWQPPDGFQRAELSTDAEGHEHDARGRFTSGPETGATKEDVNEAGRRLLERIRTIHRAPNVNLHTSQYLGQVKDFFPGHHRLDTKVANSHVIYDPETHHRSNGAAEIYKGSIYVGPKAFGGRGSSGSLGDTFVHEVEHLVDKHAGKPASEFTPRYRQMMRELDDEPNMMQYLGKYGRDNARRHVVSFFDEHAGHALTPEEKEEAADALMAKANQIFMRRWESQKKGSSELSLEGDADDRLLEVPDIRQPESSGELSTDAEGREHRGKGPGGGQFVSKDGAGDSASGSAPKAKPKATRGEMVSVIREGKGKDARLVLADGSAAPAHIKPSMVPPQWRDVKISIDPHVDVLVQAKDKKGNAKTVYSDNWNMKAQAAKFARVHDALHEMPEMEAQVQRDRADPKKGGAADATWLMMEQGTRPGSEADNKGTAELFGHVLKPEDVEIGAKDKSGVPKVSLTVAGQTVVVKDKKARAELARRIEKNEPLLDSTFWLKSHGATTLEGRHVVQLTDGVHLQFMGKESVWHDHRIRDPKLAAMLLERKKAAGDRGKLFGVSDRQVSAYAKTLDGGGFSPKDWRTARATREAIEEIEQMERPTNEKEYKHAAMAVAKKVSSLLGNEPAQALSSYISPVVFSGWRANLG